MKNSTEEPQTNIRKVCQNNSCSIENFHVLNEKEMPEKLKDVRNSSEEFLIINMNSRSLVNTYEELEFICEQLKPDLICITETWLDDSSPQNAYIPTGYKVIRKDRSKDFKKKYNKSSGGGIAIFHKEHIILEKKTFLTDKTEEILWVQPKIKESFLLGLIYKPN